MAGDWVYGGACNELPGQALHAAQLTFPDPADPRQSVTVRAPLTAALAQLWSHLRDGGELTARELEASERSRLGMPPADDPEAAADRELPTGWHRPTWLSRSELADLQREIDQDSDPTA